MLLEIIASISGIATAIVACGWFLYTRKINYFEKGDFLGCYKIFHAMGGRPETELAIIELRINHISSKGWFVGRIDYAEIFRPLGARSEGGWNCIGFLKYSFKNDLFSFLHRSDKNPLVFDRSKGYSGVLYLISRNDFDIRNRNWEEFLVESYQITHFRNTFRLALSNKKILNDSLVTNLPSELFMVNTDIVKDHLYDFDTKTEFESYPGFK
jgi:hypothetical protein